MTLRTPTAGTFKAGRTNSGETAFAGTINHQNFPAVTLNTFAPGLVSSPGFTATMTPTDGQWWPRTKSQ